MFFFFRGCPLYEVEWKLNQQMDPNLFPPVILSLEPQFLIEKDFRHLLPQVIEKPLKKPRGKKKTKVVEKDQLDLVKMLKKINLESNPELPPSPLAGESNSSLLSLTPGLDDSAEMSSIVSMICIKKHKSRRPTKFSNIQETHPPTDTAPLKNDSSTNLQDVQAQIQSASKSPHLNFSLNFSLSKLLETSDASFQILPTALPPSQDLTSTPLKPINRLLTDNEFCDSFSTPPPLAARFSKLHL